MQDEVLEMDEFAVDPERRMRVKEVATLEKALADRRAGDPLVEVGKRDCSLRKRPQQALDGQFGKIARQ